MARADAATPTAVIADEGRRIAPAVPTRIDAAVFIIPLVPSFQFALNRSTPPDPTAHNPPFIVFATVDGSTVIFWLDTNVFAALAAFDNVDPRFDDPPFTNLRVEFQSSLTSSTTFPPVDSPEFDAMATKFPTEVLPLFARSETVFTLDLANAGILFVKKLVKSPVLKLWIGPWWIRRLKMQQNCIISRMGFIGVNNYKRKYINTEIQREHAIIKCVLFNQKLAFLRLFYFTRLQFKNTSYEIQINTLIPNINVTPNKYIIWSQSNLTHNIKIARMFGSYGNFQRGKKECRNGPGCYYLARGRCHFFHPSSHMTSQATSSSRVRRNEDIFSNISPAMRTDSYRRRPAREEEEEESFTSSIMRLFFQMRSSEQRQKEEEQLEKKRAEMEKKRREEMEKKRKQEEQRRVEMEQYMKEMKEKQKKEKMKRGEIQTTLTGVNKWFFLKSRHSYYENTNLIDNKKYEQCSICLTDYKDQTDDFMITELYCRHNFHTSCIEKWLENSVICPMCKQDFRDHEQYKQFDPYYKIRIQNEAQFSRVSSMLDQLRQEGLYLME